MTDKKRMAAEAAKQKDHNNSTTKRSQKQVVLRDLERRTRKGISSMEMWEKYNITRLSSIIFRLRMEGYKIDTVMVESASGAKYARYYYRGNK